MKTTWIYVAGLLSLLASSSSQAAGLFDSDSILEITLRGPVSALVGDRENRRERSFSLEMDGGTVPVALRVRGKSRVELCSFPPLRLNFTPDSASGTPFAGQDKLKLVTHCKGSTEYEQNVLEEFLTYRLLNVLTDISVRTRLLRVNYVDSDHPGSGAVTRYGFLIEPIDATASRIGGQLLGVRNVSRKLLDVEHSALVYVFHYLIGNTDWSLVRNFEDEYCCHNGNLFQVGERNYILPFDFDMSGLVNARYAKPQPELRLRSVRVRRYRGYCTDRVVLTEALRTVVSQRDAILGVVAEVQGLSAKNRQKQHDYLEGFFSAAVKEDKLLKDFERRCL